MQEGAHRILFWMLLVGSHVRKDVKLEAGATIAVSPPATFKFTQPLFMSFSR
jgi:hypothetical protein